MRVKLTVLCFITFVLFINIGSGQSATGTVSGIVLDPSGGAIAGAEVLIVNDATAVQYPGKTNSEGYYVVPNIPPGTYRIQVSNSGFKTIIKPDIVIHVEDALAINFTLPIGAASEIVTVEGGAPLVNTSDASVSTVVNRKYVENMPLNGRSFQDLILLTPGVVTNSPQSSAGQGISGEFSVNGQRTESNYYMVDGVSANTGVWLSPAVPSASGSLPNATALGTTQSLVSVDALDEFRVQSSTYSAEYGRNPGAQFSFVTRSGTNQLHGTVFEYLRNNVFDANDWFNNFYGEAQPPLRQNDFGGTLGGPIVIPHVYDGKDKTFFFFSYEGLRLVQPQAASVSYVPDASLRQSAPSALQPVLNGFPLQNGPELGNGLAEFIGTWSNPSQIDSYSVRMDHLLKRKHRLFFRFAATPSSAESRLGGNFQDPAVNGVSSFTTRSYTMGASSTLSDRLSNEFRLNYSSNERSVVNTIDNFGGAIPVNLFQLQGIGPGASSTVEVDLNFSAFTPSIVQGNFPTQQRQWNLTDAVSFAWGRHQIKWGVDFRRLTPIFQQNNPVVDYGYSTAELVQSNNADSVFAIAQTNAYPVYTNFSAYGQDEWRATPRLNISMGLRWEVNPAPSAANGNVPYTLEGNGLSELSLAPESAPLWKTTWFNFAPRIGGAYILRNNPAWETVLRGGGGVFFDTGQQLGSIGYQGPGFAAYDFSLSGAFPLALAQLIPPIVNPPVTPYGTVYAFASHLQLPYTLQWNVSAEQALGASQALTLTYVGATGRRLLESSQVNVGPFNPSFGAVVIVQNGLTSDYDALQLQFQRRLGYGLQALASYTWGHAIDYGSQNSSLPYIRGNSDYDIRQNFSSAFSYDFPNGFKNRIARGLLHGWGLDDRFTARTGFPVTLNGNTVVNPATGQRFHGGLDLVPDEPSYVYGAQYPGGREINPFAFSLPPAGQEGDAPRNFVRGFGAWQMDLAVRREFPIYERLKLKFRAEAFNIFNHPNFGTINAFYCAGGVGCTFGQATATLANSLGGLSPLYQMGGPRSMQFSLKLIF